MGRFFVILVRCFVLFTLTNSSTPAIINPSQSIRDGETLLSDGGSFELGFFNPGSSTNRYLGLWLTKSPKTVLWVANRETPISDHSGVLNITREGILILYNRSRYIVLLSNSSRTAENPVAELLESGNLVIREENDSNPENFLWQSFDHPCDTFMLGMKLGSNFVTKIDRFLSSWRSAEDPARGQYSFVIDTHGYPQLLLKSGNITMFRAGPWNGIKFVSDPRPPSISNEFVFNSKEVYYQFGIQSSVRLRLTLSPSGAPQAYTWNDRTNDWVITDVRQPDQCDDYAICGPNTRCEMSRSPICVCLDGFVAKSLADWNFSDWDGGCIRRNPLQCSDKVGFLKYTGMKLPNTSSSWYDKSISLKECEGLCLKNCSCTAYANLDVRDGGSGCLIWFGDLIDTRRSTGDGQDLYVRMNATELDQTRKQLLDWSKRINIIGGIARGLLYLHQDSRLRIIHRDILLYLHQDSRLRIIHRDIKASNILVDEELNPKISDFGLARMFRGDQTEAKTNRVVGTYGYMSPEYASKGHFSVKSDAFSFGVLVLEIVSGKTNRGFRHLDPNLNLLGHAWMLWIKGTPSELIDECLAESCNSSDIIRCIHVALLCVQQRPEDRPDMSAVVLILGSEIPLPQPKQPGFFMGENPHEQSTSSNKHVTYSGGEVSLMSLEAR